MEEKRGRVGVKKYHESELFRKVNSHRISRSQKFGNRWFTKITI